MKVIRPICYALKYGRGEISPQRTQKTQSRKKAFVFFARSAVKFPKSRVVIFLWMLLLAACQRTPAIVSLPTPMGIATLPLPTATSTAASTVPPTFTTMPTETAVSTFTPAPTHTPPIPTATPDFYSPFTIQALAARTYGGGLLEIEDELEKNDTFTRYLIRYPSDGLTVYGFMSVPNEGNNFPVAIVLHGYIPPDEYDVLDYTARYADSLVKAGYFVIHPNFRNYPPSDSGPNEFRIGYAVDILNLIAIIREQSQDPYGILRRADEDNIHLWGHSMGGGVALRVITVNNEPYLKAAVLYGSMSGDEAQNYERIQEWRGDDADLFELEAPAALMRAISPIYHLDRINAAISIHHSPADATVPVEWSEELCERLQQLQHPVECFFYAGQSHTFHGNGDLLFMERVVTFFRGY